MCGETRLHSFRLVPPMPRPRTLSLIGAGRCALFGFARVHRGMGTTSSKAIKTRLPRETRLPGASFGERGQATLEFVVVGVVLVIACIGLASLWRFAGSGKLAELLLGSASHVVGQLGGVADVFMY